MPTTTEPLEILYQDEWLVAINKPAGHLVHPADNPQDNDLVAMKILRDQIGQLVYNIHRIDRPTTGVLLFGIDSAIAKHLHRALERHEVEKTYLIIVSSYPQQGAWQCKEPLQKKEDSPWQEAHTSFEVLAKNRFKNQNLTLLEATPHTGRFHQIRKHLLHSGMPVVGDYRYAGISESNELGEILGTGTRMLLQSSCISFDHPITGDKLSIKAPVDPNFSRCFYDHFSA